MNTLGDDESYITGELRDDYEYPVWYNRKKYVFYKKIYKRLKTLIHIHNDSSNYYSKMDKYIFGPSICISCISGIASFMSTTDLVNQTTQSAFGIGVGILASVTALLQSLGSAYRFSAKEESHRHAAEEYNKLGVKIRFEIEMPNEEDFTDKLEAEILDIQNKCRYFAPQFIVEKYNKLNNKKNESNKSNSSDSSLIARNNKISHTYGTINSPINEQINTESQLFLDDEESDKEHEIGNEIGDENV
jgi:hypothetical protein